MRYDIYHKEEQLENGWTVRTWHIMDTGNRCADMGYVFSSREAALAKCNQMERRSRI